jgi:hypothetical protein
LLAALSVVRQGARTMLHSNDCVYAGRIFAMKSYKITTTAKVEIWVEVADERSARVLVECTRLGGKFIIGSGRVDNNLLETQVSIDKQIVTIEEIP